MFGNGQILYSPASGGAGNFVPYTGATADVDLGTHILSAKSLQIKGTAGAGHLALKHQSANATAGGQETALFADTNGDIKYKIDGNYYTTLKTSSNTADRVYTFQNASGTLAFLTDIPTTIKLSSITAATATNSIDNTNYAQTWAWSTLTTQTGFLMTANAITTGNLLSLTASGTAHTTGYLLNVATSGANAASGTTTSAAYFSNTRTGTTSTNVAAQFVASGGTKNYAALFTGYVGMGTNTPAYPLDILGDKDGVNVNIKSGASAGACDVNITGNTGARASINLFASGGAKLSFFSCDPTGCYFGTYTGLDFLLYTNNAEVARIPYTNLNFGIGTGATVSAKLHVIKTTEQLRIGYDSTNYFKTTVASTGITTFDLAAGAGTPYFIFNKDVSFAEGTNHRFGNTTGSKLGTSTSDKLSFWNKTPIIQPTNAIAKAAYVSVGGSAVSSDDTFGTYSIGQAIQALINVGILA